MVKLIESNRKYSIYTDGNTDIRVYDGEEPPKGFRKGSHYKRIAWNKDLTAETDPRVKANGQSTKKTRIQNNSYHAWNKGLTRDSDDRVLKNIEAIKQSVKDKYGVDNIFQYTSKQQGYQVWNKGLTKETDDRMRRASESHKGVISWNKGISTPGHKQTEETKEKIRKTHLSTEFKKLRYMMMKSKGTLCVHDSLAEQQFYRNLVSLYGEDDIVRQYFDKERYPFKCDFYIKSEDKFIELHANWTHGGMPYDKSNPECQRQLAIWTEKAKTSKFYKTAIYVWTNLDVRKLLTSIRNNLNFDAIYYLRNN